MEKGGRIRLVPYRRPDNQLPRWPSRPCVAALGALANLVLFEEWTSMCEDALPHDEGLLSGE